VIGWLRRRQVRPGSSLLDVGSGMGHLLFFLRGLGFSHLIGIDPFIHADRHFPGGITVLKRRLGDISGHFDHIVLNHSFEHMGAPLEVLKQLRALLAPGGQLIISTPVASSFAWREYGRDWVQLDAPRHLFIHTHRSLELLAERAGLRIADVVYDSTEFQFWGSEQYRVGIPLSDRRSYAVSRRRSIFTRETIERYRLRAHALNSTADGDSASFYLETKG
jgi:SAM-dependent methyltransferase